VETELKERPVEIHSLELLSYEAGDGAGSPACAWMDVRCSSGTYIRSLARDIALACGSRAHLGALERLSIGPFSVEDAVGPRDFDPAADLRLLGPAEASGLGLACLVLQGQDELSRFANGGRIGPSSFVPLDGAAGPKAGEGASGKPAVSAAVFDLGGALLGIIDLEAEGPVYRVVMPQEIRA
jgi:tRNA U55 pseudouridine synthase TruB